MRLFGAGLGRQARRPYSAYWGRWMSPSGRKGDATVTIQPRVLDVGMTIGTGGCWHCSHADMPTSARGRIFVQYRNRPGTFEAVQELHVLVAPLKGARSDWAGPRGGPYFLCGPLRIDFSVVFVANGCRRFSKSFCKDKFSPVVSSGRYRLRRTSGTRELSWPRSWWVHRSYALPFQGLTLLKFTP